MMPVSSHYDEYIDRPKLNDKKNTIEYIVPPPSRGVGTIRKHLWKARIQFQKKCLILVPSLSNHTQFITYKTSLIEKSLRNEFVFMLFKKFVS